MTEQQVVSNSSHLLACDAYSHVASASIQEQLEVLLDYLSHQPVIDWTFVKLHALAISDTAKDAYESALSLVDENWSAKDTWPPVGPMS